MGIFMDSSDHKVQLNLVHSAALETPPPPALSQLICPSIRASDLSCSCELEHERL